MAGGAMPDVRTLVLAALYSVGAHGIMTLNDFKAIDGDRQMGIRSLPVQLGVQAAARVACLIMAVPQVVVVLLLILWERPVHALAVGFLLLVAAGADGPLPGKSEGARAVVQRLRRDRCT